MGGGLSRRDPEVHVVVVQSQENGKMDAKLLRQTYTSIGKGGGRGENLRNWLVGLWDIFLLEVMMRLKRLAKCGKGKASWG